MLRAVVFLLFFFSISPSTSFSNKPASFVQFSLKPYNDVKPISSPVWVLDDKFQQLAKFVRFSNDGIFQGRMKVDGSLQRIILQLNDPHFSQDQILVSLKNTNSSSMTIHSDDYKMKISTSRKTPTLLRAPVSVTDTGCHCIKGNCACCLDVQVPEFRHSLCVNVTYNPQTIGLDLSIGVDGHYFSEEISIRNPPPICFSLPIPGAEHIAGVCIAFEDLDLDRKSEILSGCVEFEVELIHLRVLHIKVGCFRMPI